MVDEDKRRRDPTDEDPRSSAAFEVAFGVDGGAVPPMFSTLALMLKNYAFVACSLRLRLSTCIG